MWAWKLTSSQRRLWNTSAPVPLSRRWLCSHRVPVVAHTARKPSLRNWGSRFITSSIICQPSCLRQSSNHTLQLIVKHKPSDFFNFQLSALRIPISFQLVQPQPTPAWLSRRGGSFGRSNQPGRPRTKRQTRSSPVGGTLWSCDNYYSQEDM